MENENKPERVEDDLDTLISRALTAEDTKKFAIAAYHFFTIFSRHSHALHPDTFGAYLQRFVYNIILSPVGLQRERMLNFVLKNENLDIFSHKVFLDKM